MSLSLEQAKVAIQSILDELNKEKVKSAISDAREAAGSDMGEIMQNVVPIFFEVQGHIMEPLGFQPDDDGFAAFAEQLKKHESDADFKKLSDALKKIMKDSTTPIEEDEEDEDEQE